MPTRWIRPWFVTLLLLLPAMPVVGRAAEPVDKPTLLSTEATEALTRAMALAHVHPVDLGFNKDYVAGYGPNPDPWRLAAVERLLATPLFVPDDAATLSGAALSADGDPAAHIEAAAVVLELGALAPPVVPAEPDRRDPAVRRWRKEVGPELGALIGWVDPALVALRARIEEATAELPEGAAEALFGSLDTTGGRTVPSGEARLEELALLAAGDAVDRGGLLAAARDAAALAAEVERRAAALPDDAWPDEPLLLAGEAGLLVVGTTGVDRFAVEAGGSYTLLLDPGGGDQHDLPAEGLLSILVELGGDDLHHVAVGAGLGGVGIAIDSAGSDQYLAPDRTAGCGIYGVGVLIDRAGDDQHRAELMAQGAAAFGVGVLVDGAGSDYFDVGGWGQAAAGVQAHGLLLDLDGDDSYRSGGVLDGWPHYRSRTFSFAQGFATGMRPLAGGGVGLLVDRDGDDAYTADLWAQAASYWFSRGYLVDLGGSDVRLGGHYVQSCPAHLTITGLFDVGGDDRYHCTAGLSQAGSHDYSVAWLIDDGGDDHYRVRDGGQGFSTTNAVSFFVDTGGDDVLRTRADSVRGAVRKVRRQGSLAFYVDLGGQDSRDGPGPEEGALLRRDLYGVGWDLEPGDLEAMPEPSDFRAAGAPRERWSVPPPSDPPLDPALAERIHAACSATSTGAVSQRLALEGAARQGPAVLSDFLPVLARGHLIDGYCFQGLIRQVRELHPGSEPAIEAAVLAELAVRPRHRGQRWLLRYLGDLEADGEAAVAAIVEAATAEDPLLRRTVADVLGRLRSDPDGVLDALLMDREETVRATAVWALGQVEAPPERLAPALDDELFLVRFNAVPLILDHPDREAALAVVRAMAEAGADQRSTHRTLRLELLHRLGDEDAVRAVAGDEGGDPWLIWFARQLLDGGP
jgi:hypothetical protein